MERKKDGKSFLGVNVKTKLCHQGSWCSFLLWDDFNLVLEEYVSGVMAFREYVTCGYQVIFLHTESAVLGGIKRLREEKPQTTNHHSSTYPHIYSTNPGIQYFLAFMRLYT